MRSLRIWIPLVALVALAAGTYLLSPMLAGRIAFAVAKGQSDAARGELAELSKTDTMSPLFRAVVKATLPSVVEVRVTKQVRTPLGPGSDLDELFRRFFEEGAPDARPRRNAPPPRRTVPGLGSGVVIDAKNGYVVTNWHVVAGADKVHVGLSDGRKLDAEWVRTDRKTDLAIIKIEADKLMAAPLADSDQAQVGDWVLAIGSPRGLFQTVTAGIVSAKGRMTGLGATPGGYQDFIQTDAAINRGNSGGPLVNMAGEVVGINSQISTTSGGYEGIGFAIPSNMVRRVMTQLIEKGTVVRGYLGVVIQNVDERLAKSLKIPTTKGALIAQIGEGGPADRAGLEVGDFIVSINDRRIEDMNDLRNTVAALEPDKSYPFVLYRDGKKRTIKVAVAEQPEDMAGAFREVEPGTTQATRFGVEVANLTAEMAAKFRLRKSVEGVVITEVESGSDAEEQGLRPGMVITHVQGKRITSVDEFRKAISDKEAASGVRLRLTAPGGARRFVFITPTKTRK